MRLERNIIVENKHFCIGLNGDALVLNRTDYKTIPIEGGIWNDEVSGTEIWDDVDNPIKVIRELFMHILNFIVEHKLHYFHFSSEEKSRSKLYDRFAKSISKKLSFAYHVIKNNHSREYYFYRSQ